MHRLHIKCLLLHDLELLLEGTDFSLKFLSVGLFGLLRLVLLLCDALKLGLERLLLVAQLLLKRLDLLIGICLKTKVVLFSLGQLLLEFLVGLVDNHRFFKFLSYVLVRLLRFQSLYCFFLVI